MEETLAVKYRPRTFEDITEQQIIKTILGNQLRTKKTKNAYLFVGPAGCGKTTAARIFANDINEGKGTPIEIDAASNNGVENVRTIIEQSKYRSLDSDYKVFIIDEVHMLSIGAWNALLKLLEEPPSGTVFIMATTDPQKIPNTILSRVQRYDFHKISIPGIESRLKQIINKEFPDRNDGFIPLRFADDAINYIAKQANGGMRDAISMMDKCIAMYNGAFYVITIEHVIECLATVNYETMFSMLQCLLYKELEDAKMFSIIDEIFNSGKDLKLFLKNFLNFVVDFVKYYHTNDLNLTLIPNTDNWHQRLDSLCDEDGILCDADTILDATMRLQNDIKFSSFPKPIIEASLILLRRKVAK